MVSWYHHQHYDNFFSLLHSSQPSLKPSLGVPHINVDHTVQKEVSVCWTAVEVMTTLMAVRPGAGQLRELVTTLGVGSRESGCAQLLNVVHYYAVSHCTRTEYCRKPLFIVSLCQPHFLPPGVTLHRRNVPAHTISLFFDGGNGIFECQVGAYRWRM